MIVQRIRLNDLRKCMNYRSAQMATQKLYKKYAAKSEWDDICKAVDYGMRLGFFCENEVCHGK